MKYRIQFALLVATWCFVGSKAIMHTQIDSIISNRTNSLGDKDIDVLVLIQPTDLESLMQSYAEIKSSSSSSEKSFLGRFSRFLIPFGWDSNNDTLFKNMLKLARNVADHNLKQHGNKMESWIELWIAIIPKGNISKMVDDVLVVVADANSRFNGTISTLLLNYRYLQLSAESLPLVRQDIRFAKRQIQRYSDQSLKAGAIFQQLNCRGQRRGEYLQSLQLSDEDQLIFMPRLPSDPAQFLTSAACADLQQIIKPQISIVLYVRVMVNLENGTYSFDHVHLKQLYSGMPPHIISGKGSVIVEATFINHGNNLVTNKINTKLWGLHKDWLRHPTTFNKSHIGITVYFQDELKTLNETVPTVLTNFRKVIIESRVTYGSNDTESLLMPVFVGSIASLAKVLATRTEFRHKFKIFNVDMPLELMLVANTYTGDVEANRKSVYDTFFAARFGNRVYPNLVNAVVLSWGSCFEREAICVESDDIGIRSSQEKTYFFAHRLANFFPVLYYAVMYKNYIQKQQKEILPNLGIFWEHKFCSQLYEAILDPPSNHTILTDLFRAADAFILKIVVNKQDIVENGAENVALSTTENLLICEPFILIAIPKLYGTKVPFYVKLTGCNGNYSEMKELKELVKFWELMNSWAVKENRTVIMDTAFEHHRNVSKDQSECNINTAYLPTGNCDCGWWKVTKTTSTNGSLKLAFQDRKSVALKLYEEINAPKNRHGSGTVDNSEQLIMLIAIPTVLTIAILSIVTTYFVHRYRSKHILSKLEMQYFVRGIPPTEHKKNDHYDDMEGSGLAESLPYNKEKYELKSSSFKIDLQHCLGTGEFGSVYRGIVKRDNVSMDVAVKMTNNQAKRVGHGAYLRVKALISEIKILSYVGEHKHIVKFEGACTENLRSGKTIVFLEFCQLGSLDKFLRSCNVGEVNSDCVGQGNKLPVDISHSLFKWAVNIAEGMEFLASKNLVHCDLATRNILLDSEKCAKISDFGLSRRLYEYSEYLKTEPGPLPWRWMAPESLRRMIFNEKTDVWAFGVTLWEMYTLGDEPYPGLSWDINFPALLEREMRLQEPKYNERNMYSVMRRCWDAVPFNRPTFSQIRLLLADYTDIL